MKKLIILLACSFLLSFNVFSQSNNGNNCLQTQFDLAVSNIPVNGYLWATMGVFWDNPNSSQKVLYIEIPDGQGGLLFWEERIIENKGPGQFYASFPVPVNLGWNVHGTATVYRGKKKNNICDIIPITVNIF